MWVQTPVLIITTPHIEDQWRFDGLKELARHCTREELLSGNVNFNFDNRLVR